MNEDDAGWFALGVTMLILGSIIELGGAFIFRSWDWVYAGLPISIAGGALIIVCEIVSQREWVLRAK